MLQTLSQQLHFVRAIQCVDTTGVEPLRSIRDETKEGEREAEVGMEKLSEALGMEEMRGEGRFGRIRRRKGGKGVDEGNEEAEKEEAWDVLGAAGRKTGRYFVVEGGKKEG